MLLNSVSCTLCRCRFTIFDKISKTVYPLEHFCSNIPNKQNRTKRPNIFICQIFCLFGICDVFPVLDYLHKPILSRIFLMPAFLSIFPLLPTLVKKYLARLAWLVQPYPLAYFCPFALFVLYVQAKIFQLNNKRKDQRKVRKAGFFSDNLLK